MKKLILIFCLLLAFTVQAKDVPLAWDHDCDVTGFHIYRSQGASHWPELVGTVQCPTLTFTDADVPRGSLSWVVTAYDDNESGPSNEVALAYYYARIVYDHDTTTGRILYKGENADIAAAGTDTDWVVSKYYYNVETGSLTEIRVRTMAWDSRTTGW
jgi:hypothetical protein